MKPLAYRDRALSLRRRGAGATSRRKAGTPCYVYSARRFSKISAPMTTASATLPHTVCYAVKANGNLATAAAAGGGRARDSTSFPAANCSAS